MKKIVRARAHVLFLLLVVVLVTPVHASVTTQAIINQDIRVLFDFRNISPDIYGNITITETTIPETIKNNLMQRGLTHVDYRYAPFSSIKLVRYAPTKAPGMVVRVRINPTL
jgi:hypothetical protein